MKRLKNLLKAICRSAWLKYGVVTVFAVILIGFVDENSLWNHYANERRIGALQDEIEQYQRQYQHDKEQIRQLESDPKAIEKIARERYFMKADDEDIFVLSDDPKPTSHSEYENLE